jgi:hypothetical protein
VEAGQREVKQNLVKFNNFVREKQGKVEGGLERARMEVVLQVRRGCDGPAFESGLSPCNG